MLLKQYLLFYLEYIQMQSDEITVLLSTFPVVFQGHWYLGIISMWG